MDAVVTRNLHKRYDTVDALRGVSLEVRAGETFGLLGPNGAGKTTLQQILCTLISATEGEAYIDGIRVIPDSQEVRKRLGVVFQVQTLEPIMSAEENLRLHGRLYKVSKKDMDARIPDLLEIAQLSDRAKEPVNTFSGGMKRRLEIVRALLHRPQILLLDEPTIGLDPQSRRLIWERIGVMKKEYGITVLLTTHYMDEADSLCDRIAIIDHGEIIALDTPEAMKGRLGGDRLELTVAHSAAILAEQVRVIPHVLGAEVKDDVVRVRLREPGPTIPRILQTAAILNVPVTHMHHKQQTMDDVFLDFTGKVRDKPKRKRRDGPLRRFARSIMGGQ